jgi:hypothetical protein
VRTRGQLAKAKLVACLHVESKASMQALTQTRIWLVASVFAYACGSPAPTQQDPILVMKVAPAAGSGGQSVSHASAGGGAGAMTAGQAAPTLGTCCEAQPAAACAPHDVEQCVCAQVPSCCQSGWDIVCAQLVETLSCGSCKKSCCEASMSTGCTDASVQACVCKGDASCCNSGWDAFCVTLVKSLGCGSC